ncbi:MAG: hypothetical protein JWN86_4383 [Planctomycetota bacterium]|nr:hypothetical protein [Planctomycetota bacterium]
MVHNNEARCTAFVGTTRIAAGGVATVALKAKEAIDRGDQAPVLIFDDETSELIELDLRGTADDVLGRLEATGAGRVAEETTCPESAAARGPGRPRLGVVAREVTLLPRHWDWLSGQPGGASVALRKLVEAARRENEGQDRFRRAQESAYRFMSTMAGNLPGFEEATRAFFAGDRQRFHERIESWPVDVKDHATRLAAVVFS